MTKTKNILRSVTKHLPTKNIQQAINSLKQSNNDIIVFSHLRWEFVYQRPQHIMSRFAKNRRVLFVEEASADSASSRDVIVQHVTSNLTIVRPQRNFSYQELGKKIELLSNKYHYTNPILWFYSPMFVGVTPFITHQSIVYDCMDELSHFKNAPIQLVAQEKILLSLSDVVFTGGKSLFEAKSPLHENAYCFPSSVDRKHFSQTRLTIPKDMQQIPYPRVGFYGVLDERLDKDLLKDAALRRPDISFVLIGPIVKIDPKELPQLPNIFYLGVKSYEELPHYLHTFDVAMMPFVLSAATEFISPTKTLEFMAGNRPIISTPITDVVRDYQHCIRIVATAKQFDQAISYYLTEEAKEREERLTSYNTILSFSSWDTTVEEMEKVMKETLKKKALQQLPSTKGWAVSLAGVDL